MRQSISIESIKEALFQTKKELSDFLETEAAFSSNLKSSAVLILIVNGRNGLELVLTRRAYHLKNHPGQISFAGGASEGHDSDLFQTAIREAYEEIGLPKEHVEILGSFKGNETISGFYMTPVVAFSQYQGPWLTDPNEVHSMITIPLNWAMHPKRWRKENGFFKGEKRSYLTAWWQQQLIWGATAQLLENLRIQLSLQK